MAERPGPERYLRADHSSVDVPSRVARILLRQAGLADYHARHRGLDAEFDDVLVALKTAAAAWVERKPTEAPVRKSAEAAASSECMRVPEVADLLGVTQSRVRQACRAGLLTAERVGKAWAIQREHVERYRAARAA
jgi:excisionase family DNA binding protein